MSIRCEPQGNPTEGAAVTKCDFSDFGFNEKCTQTDAVSGNTNFNCHIKP